MLEWRGVMVNGVGAGYVLKGHRLNNDVCDSSSEIWKIKGSSLEEAFAAETSFCRLATWLTSLCFNIPHCIVYMPSCRLSCYRAVRV